jgi:hypothetical protein
VDVSGGAEVSGQAVLGTSVEPVGGVIVGGETEEFITFWNAYRDRDYLYGVGEIVYLRVPKKNRPSRYHQHMIEGVRLYGDYNLYDIGIGILVDESMLVSPLNKDVIQSQEATATEEYATGRIDKIDNTPVLSDPVGGDLATTEDLSDEAGPNYSPLLSARNRLRDISPLPDPTGGIVQIPSTECCPGVPSGLQAKLNRLRNTTPLADPVGGTMSFEMTESRPSDPSSRLRSKLVTLERTPVIPDPVGGIIAITHRDDIEDIDVSSIKRKLETLGDIAVLPDPEGSYIIRSVETEPV